MPNESLESQNARLAKFLNQQFGGPMGHDEDAIDRAMVCIFELQRRQSSTAYAAQFMVCAGSLSSERLYGMAQAIIKHYESGSDDMVLDSDDPRLSHAAKIEDEPAN